MNRVEIGAEIDAVVAAATGRGPASSYAVRARIRRCAGPTMERVGLCLNTGAQARRRRATPDRNPQERGGMVITRPSPRPRASTHTRREAADAARSKIVDAQDIAGAPDLARPEYGAARLGGAHPHTEVLVRPEKVRNCRARER